MTNDNAAVFRQQFVEEMRATNPRLGAADMAPCYWERLKGRAEAGEVWADFEADRLGIKGSRYELQSEIRKGRQPIQDGEFVTSVADTYAVPVEAPNGDIGWQYVFLRDLTLGEAIRKGELIAKAAARLGLVLRVFDEFARYQGRYSLDTTLGEIFEREGRSWQTVAI